MNSNDDCNLNLYAEYPTSFRSENHGLYAEAENRILRRVIKDCSDPELPAEQFFKCTRAFCDLKKEDNSREKNVVALFVTRERAARAKARSARTTRTPDVERPGSHSAFDPDPDLAPWGRNPDGVPYTEEEFQTSLAAAVRDIYGIDPFTDLPDAADPDAIPDIPDPNAIPDVPDPDSNSSAAAPRPADMNEEPVASAPRGRSETGENVPASAPPGGMTPSGGMAAALGGLAMPRRAPLLPRSP